MARSTVLAIVVIAGIAPTAEAQSTAGGAARSLAAPARGVAAATAATSGEVRSSTTARTTRTTHRDAVRRDTDELGDPTRGTPPPVTFDLAVATHVPVSLGVEANLTLPLGFLLRAHAGFTPEPYVGVINDIAQSFGAYDDTTAQIVSRSGSNAFVLRLSGGMRPVPGYGFEILAGYTMIHGGATISADDFEAATGQSMDYPGLESVGISATLHAFHVELGWTAVVWDHLVIRGSIGWVHTLGSEGAIDVPAELRARAGGRIEEVEQDVRDGMRDYGFSPEARVAVGYQF